MRRLILQSLAAGVLVTAASAASAQVPAGDPPPAAQAATAAAPPQAPAATAADDDDLEPQATQPDFTIVNLPTTLRLPQHKLAFRVAHRFTRSLNQGSFRDSLSDAFGLDSGARIGLELRFSPVRGAQVGVFRSNDKTIDFFGEYNLLQQGGGIPISLSAIGAVEGTSNFKGEYSPSLGVSIGRSLGEVAAIYVVPMWINHTNLVPGDLVHPNNTVLIGLGARVQLVRHLYLAAEVSPRASGFKGAFGSVPNQAEGKTAASFALEKQVGGHVFQINFSNAFALTPANLARGAAPGKTNWYLGFNISRKFY